MDKLTASDLSKIIGTKGVELQKYCRDLDLDSFWTFVELSGRRKNELILKILKKIESAPRSGYDYKKKWQKGWLETLNLFKRSNFKIEAPTPKYIRSGEPVRLLGDYVLPKDSYFELSFFKILRRYLFFRYLSGYRTIYEFGCGSGHNLIELAQMFPDKELHGLDWTRESKEILRLASLKYKFNIQGHIFDMFKPNRKLKIKKNSAAFAFGSLEQLGKNFKKFLQYLISNKVCLFIHQDSIEELYDLNNLSDYLAYLHDKKRNYLSGYFKYIQELERNRIIKILKIKKVSCGGLYHDGYSYDIWKAI